MRRTFQLVLQLFPQVQILSSPEQLLSLKVYWSFSCDTANPLWEKIGGACIYLYFVL
jgi:hypothetical protein